MVMTSDFHPGNPGSIPLVGDKSFLISIHIFNLVPNSLTTGYYNFQHSVVGLPMLAYEPKHQSV
jgi:hypothetical protein